MQAFYKRIPQTVWLLLLAMLLLSIACTPSPRRADYNGSAKGGVETVQYKNVTPALPDFQPMDKTMGPVENATSLARKMRESPNGIAAADNPVKVSELPEKTEEPAERTPIITEPLPSLTALSAPSFKPAKIAFLLPLSGNNAPIGKSIESAVQLAMFELGQGTKSLSLIVLDTQGTEIGASRSAIQALDQGADIIFGPLTAEETASVIPLTTQRKVPLVSFSSSTQLAREGVYIFGYSAGEQIKRAMEYAYSQGIREFSALLPESPFGATAMDAISDMLKRRNTGVKRVEYYKTDDTQLASNILRLTYTDPANPQLKPSSEALIIPEGGRVLFSITSKLFRSGVNSEQFRLIGSSEWDDPLILDEPRLAGSWFATAPPDLVLDFNQRFRKINGYEPIRLASLGYDAMAMTFALAANSRSDRFSTDAFTNPNGFNGANGLFRFTKGNVAQRALAVVSVDKGRLQVLDPAPTIFKNSITSIPRL